MVINPRIRMHATVISGFPINHYTSMYDVLTMVLAHFHGDLNKQVDTSSNSEA